jgi:cytochrome b involved in lipid metabolism
MMESRMKSALVANPNDIFYTEEEIAKHTSDEDCWTILNGRVYDITEYAKFHPGGRKIFLGKGKDCTELYNKYHHYVNAAMLIGKY